jgi:hypothetical protein
MTVYFKSGTYWNNKNKSLLRNRAEFNTSPV